MTFFVKAGKDWFYYLTSIDSLDNNGQEMIMRSIDTETTFPEEIIDFYNCPFNVGETYTAFSEFTRETYAVVFDGMSGDNVLQFSATENILLLANRQGIGYGHIIRPQKTEIGLWDKIALNNVVYKVVATNVDVTLVSDDDGALKLFCTDYLITTFL